MNLQHEAAKAVFAWIVEKHGEKVAETWIWACTPFPAGLPLDYQLEEGFQLALGEVTLNELLRRTEEAMTKAFEEYRQQHGKDEEDEGSAVPRSGEASP